MTEVACNSCGGANRASAKFCGTCGAALVTEVVCPRCGASHDPRRRFCDECGSALKGAAAPEPAQAPSRPASSSPSPGRSFGGGRYEIDRFIGEGGRKRVYLARDTQLGREVALSVFKAEGADSNALQRARREAEAMGRLGSHPNIVTVYDIGEEDGDLFLVSQFMPGGDLAGLLAQAESGRLATAEVVRIAGDVARALEHAHAEGIVHRDVKPHNVWLAPDGTAKLGDFGLAMDADRSRLTAEGAMVGTVAYMSPEQGVGRDVDGRSDLYSLGALMYELICGIPPFVGDGAAAVISQHVSGVPVAPSWHRDDVPRALEQLVLKLLAKRPEDRLADAREVREALDAIAAAGDPEAEPAQDTARALDRLTEAALIGREAETNALRGALDEALAGRGRIVLVAGEAGIGKSRLAAEIETYADLRGARVLRGRCYEGDGAPAFWPWMQVIRAYAHDRDPEELISELGSGASDIAQLVSEVRARLPDLPEPQPLDPEQARFRLFDSVATFLRNASGSKALAIFLEDLHLADTPSLMLLQFLARELSSARIFLLGTYREAEAEDEARTLGELHGALTHERGYQRLRLQPLSEREVKALLEEVSRQSLETADELALAQTVYAESGGNPYFIEEIVRHLVESGAIYQRDSRWVSDARHIRELGIPQGVRDAVARRLGRLSDECRAVLQVAAVSGQQFRIEVLERLSGLPAATVFDRVCEAADADVVSPVPDELNRYRFDRVATRDALYEELPESRRIDLHRAVGEALEDLYEERIESHLGELAHHFAKAAPAGLAEKAADYSWWAGEQAASVFAYEASVEHYSRALRLFETLEEEPVRRCELLLALGDARWRSGDVAGARETFLEAVAIAERLSLPDQYARAALGYGGGQGGFSVSDSANERLIELLRTALETVPGRDSVLRVRLLARLAVEVYYTSDQAQADALSREAVEMAERVGDARILLLAKYSRQLSTLGPDRQEDDLAAEDEIVRLAQMLGDPEMEFQGHHLRVDTLLQLGDIKGVDREIRACERLAQDLRQPRYDWQVAVFRVMRALMQGRFEEGSRLAQSAAALGGKGQGEVATVVFGAHAFITHWAAGTLGELTDGGRAFADRYPNSAWPAAFTWLMCETGDERAGPQFEAVVRHGLNTIRRDGNWMTAMACLAMACHDIGDSASAATLYDMLSPYGDRCVSILTAAACLGSNHAFLGHLAEAAGRLDRAAEHYERALDESARIGAHLVVPRICAVYAQMLLRRGAAEDRDRAADLIDRGLERARELGTPKEAERLLTLKLGRDTLADVAASTSIELVARSVEEARPDISRAAAPDGTVTILFSDIEDSTMLTERLGDQRWLALLERHNAIVRRHVTAHGGYEVKSQGDGFMLAFASARRAIQCAIDVQRDLDQRRARHPEEPLRVRIGLHTGEALRVDEDFFGKNVILAARIAGQAKGGEILVSALLRDLVASTDDFSFSAEREVELKGLRGSYRLCSVRWSEEPADDASPEADTAEPPAALRAVAPPRIVGRGAELAQIAALRQKAFAGSTRTILIEGEPGIGKSELAARAAADAAAEGALVLQGRCSEESSVAYQPWVEALTHYVDAAPQELLAAHVDRHGGEIARLVPALLRRLPSAPAPARSSDPETERYLTFGAAVDVLAAAAAERGLVLVLDDLHWADNSTLSLLQRVTSREAMRLLVIVTTRQGEVAEHVGGHEPHRLQLAGLGEEDLVRMMQAATGAEPGADVRRLIAEVRRETGGNPFFAAEMLRHLLETGQIVPGGRGTWELADPSVRPELPAGVREVVRSRVQQLGDEVAGVLGAAAVIAPDIGLDVLARVAGLDRDAVDAPVGHAVDAALLRAAGDGRVEFAHALVQHTVYQDLGATGRARLHRRAAEALDELGGGTAHVAQMAHHWWAAGDQRDPARAVACSIAAGRRALAELAPDDALRWFGRAHELVSAEHDADAALRCDLLIGLGDAQRQAGERRYRRTLLEASDVAHELADGERMARAVLANNRGWTSRVGRVDGDRVRALERALGLVDERSPETRARLLAQLALELTYSGDLARRRALSDEALALARSSGNERAVAFVLGRRYMPIWAPETLEDRRETVSELADVAGRLDDPIAHLGAVSWQLLLAFETGDMPGLDDALARKSTLAERIGRPVMRWEACFQRSARAYLAGRLDEAEALAGKAAELGREQPDAAAVFGAQIVAVRYDQGRLGEIVDAFREVAKQNPGLSTFQAALALVLCEIGRLDEARDVTAPAVGRDFADIPRDNLWLTTVAAYADTCAQLGDEAGAAALYPQIEPYKERVAFNGVNANGCLARQLGLLAATLGRLDEAERHLALAAEVHERIGAEAFLARTRYEWAKALLARGANGDDSRARDLLGQALEAAGRLGCASLEQRVRETTATAGTAMAG